MSDNTIIRRRIDEFAVPGRIWRTGRHVEHDPRSRRFPYTTTTAAVATLRRKRRIGPFDQGDLGSCTGNATAGAMCTAPFTHRFVATSQRTPLRIYSAATQLDTFPGTYKPDDTGSSGLAAAKAVKALGWITSYTHAFDLDTTIQAIADPGAVPIFGIDWFDSFDSPGSDGGVAISPDAQVRGGHEIQCSGIELANPGTYSGADKVWFWQSWGDWALGGQFYLTVDTLARLLANQGDCTVLHR